MTDHLSPGIERLRAVLDAVLVPAGFAAAQGGGAGGPGQTGGFTWCAAARDFADRYPHLPPSQEQVTAWGSRCVDVTLDVVNASGIWRVTTVHLEGEDLWSVLAALGDHDGATAARALLDADLGACTEQLATLLSGAFTRGGSGHRR